MRSLDDIVHDIFTAVSLLAPPTLKSSRTTPTTTNTSDSSVNSSSSKCTLESLIEYLSSKQVLVIIDGISTSSSRKVEEMKIWITVMRHIIETTDSIFFTATAIDAYNALGAAWSG